MTLPSLSTVRSGRLAAKPGSCSALPVWRARIIMPFSVPEWRQVRVAKARSSSVSSTAQSSQITSQLMRL